MPKKAFTLIEVLAVLVILSILATLAFAGYQQYMAKAAGPVCMSNLRNLGNSFQNYINDHGNRWPPHPSTSDPNSEISENYWIKLFEVNYQIPANTWQCPILKKNRVASSNGRVLKLHYIPSLFDGTPGRPMELNSGGKKHPWLMEISDAHGNGALMFFPQLGVVSMNQLLRDNGIKSN